MSWDFGAYQSLGDRVRRRLFEQKRRKALDAVLPILAQGARQTVKMAEREQQRLEQYTPLASSIGAGPMSVAPRPESPFGAGFRAPEVTGRPAALQSDRPLARLARGFAPGPSRRWDVMERIRRITPEGQAERERVGGAAAKRFFESGAVIGTPDRPFPPGRVIAPTDFTANRAMVLADIMRQSNLRPQQIVSIQQLAGQGDADARTFMRQLANAILAPERSADRGEGTRIPLGRGSEFKRLGEKALSKAATFLLEGDPTALENRAEIEENLSFLGPAAPAVTDSLLFMTSPPGIASMAAMPGPTIAGEMGAVHAGTVAELLGASEGQRYLAEGVGGALAGLGGIDEFLQAGRAARLGTRGLRAPADVATNLSRPRQTGRTVGEVGGARFGRGGARTEPPRTRLPGPAEPATRDPLRARYEAERAGEALDIREGGVPGAVGRETSVVAPAQAPPARVPPPPEPAAARAAGGAPLTRAADDFEPVSSEAIRESAADQAAKAGGRGPGAAEFLEFPESRARELRPFEDVVGEVVTYDDPIRRTLIGRTGINPSVLDNTDIGKAITAYYRQRGAAENLTATAVASALDAHTDPLGRLPIRIDNDGMATLDDGAKVPWNDLFSSDKYRARLTDAQAALIDDYRRVVEEMEFLRVQAGLKPRATAGPAAAEGWYYIPRQVKGIRGNELRRPSSPNLQRHYDDALEGMKNGVRYESDPRAVLDLHVRNAYREIVERQLSDYLEPLSITAKQLIPEPVLKQMSDAVLRRRAAERGLRAARASRQLADLDKEIQKARLAVERGRTALAGTQDVRRAQERLRQLELQQRRLSRMREVDKPAARGQVRANVATAQARLDTAMAAYRTARARYTKALEAARRSELAPGNLFGRAEDKIPVAQWRNRFFPLEDAQRLSDELGSFLRTPQKANWVGRGFEVLGNHIRFLSAVGDFAAPFIQGLPLLGRNPVGWGRAALRHYQAWFDPAVQARYIRDHIGTFQEMAAHNVPVGDVEFFKALKEGGGLSPGALLELVPKGAEARRIFQQLGKQSFGRFQASYDMFLTGARAELWEGMKHNWQGSLDDLAAHVRNMTGGLDSRALGVGPTQRGVEATWLAFSPRLLRSTAALVGDLARGPRDPRGFAALRALGGLVAGTVGAYVASGIALAKSEAEIRRGLNPAEGKPFLSHQINGDWVGVGGQIRALLQLMARSLTAPESLKSRDQFDNPLLQFIGSRGAPGLRLAQSGVEYGTGGDVDALPFDDIDSLPELGLHIGQSALPFAIQGVIEGEQPLTSALALGGARTSPERPREAFARLYQQKYGEEPPEGASPRALNPELAAEAGYSATSEFQQERSEILAGEEGYLADLAPAVLRRDPQAGAQFADEISGFFKRRASVTDALVRQYDLPERGASLVQQFYDLDARDHRDPETHVPDYDYVDAERARILEELRQAGHTQAATALEEGVPLTFGDQELQRAYDAWRHARKLRDELAEIPQFSGLSVELHHELLDFRREVTRLRERAERDEGLNISMSDGIRRLGRIQGRPAGFIEAALLLGSTPKKNERRNPAYEAFIVNNADELLLFYPDLETSRIRQMLYGVSQRAAGY